MNMCPPSSLSLVIGKDQSTLLHAAMLRRKNKARDIVAAIAYRRAPGIETIEAAIEEAETTAYSKVLSLLEEYQSRDTVAYLADLERDVRAMLDGQAACGARRSEAAGRRPQQVGSLRHPPIPHSGEPQTPGTLTSCEAAEVTKE